MWVLIGVLVSHFLMASTMGKIVSILILLTAIVVVHTLDKFGEDMEKFRDWWHKGPNNY